MLFSIALFSWFCVFISLPAVKNGSYTDIATFTIFLLIAILFTSHIGLKDKLKQQSEEIEKLKAHLGIKDCDDVNQNNENQND